ncbi:MAG: hypothetical protein RBS88_06510 [Spongiibacteraceae bacterium]|jgi:hypothetical protein|nr:hypothetical protein [Spongiibacteraceae bacterium]
MNSRFLMLPLVIGTAVAGSMVHALEFNAKGDLRVEHSDNARRSSDEKISELQEQVALEVGGVHAGERVTANFRYRAERWFFSEDSQSDRTSLEGLASVRWEQIEQALFWDLEHSRKDVLRDNALVDIQENRDERDLTTLSPLLVLRLTDVDLLQARLNYTLVTYREAEDLDSERYGGSLSWLHYLSPTDFFSVTAESSEVDFDSRLQEDYRYDALTLAYSAQLARISYTVTVGYNSADRDRSGDFSGPIYGLDVRFNDGLNEWYAHLDSRITDSSLGDANRSIFEGINVNDTTLGRADVMKKTLMEVGVESQAICSVCRVGAAIFFDREDYDTQPRDNDEYGIELDGTYRLSQQSALRASYRFRSISYSGSNNPRSDYDQHEYLLEYNRRITNNFSGEIYVGRSERDGSGQFGQSYDENIVGIRLSYKFL